MLVALAYIGIGVIALFLLALIADAVYTDYLDWKWQQYLDSLDESEI